MIKINAIRIGAILLLVFIATSSDLKSRRIPNKLTMPFIIIGMGLNALASFPAGLRSGVFGLLVGFLIFFVPYIMKAMGAGDVKLMAAIGTLSGWEAVLYIALFTAVSGGVIVLVKKIMSGGLLRTLKRTASLLRFYLFSLLALFFPLPTVKVRKEQYRVDTSDKKNDFIPYAVAIAAGTVITLILSRTGMIQGLSI